MALTIDAADAYVDNYVLDNEDWTQSDAARKQRLINVADREIRNKYAAYTIPDEAVYDFAAVLSVAFNETMTNARRGIQQVTITGAAAFTFASAGGTDDISKLIPKTTRDLINGAPENADLPKITGGKTPMWTVV